MNKKYIEKETAINAIEDTSCYLCKKYIRTKKCNCDCEIWRNKKILQGISPADVKPVVRGEWICVPANVLEISRGYVFVNKCSKCGYRYSPENDNFCPNCGAEMKEQ